MAAYRMEAGRMTPYSADAAQAILNAQQMALDWLLGSLPVGAVVLIAAVSLAVSWLSWSERRGRPAHVRHFRA